MQEFIKSVLCLDLPTPELDEIMRLIGFGFDYLPPATSYQKLCFFQDWFKNHDATTIADAVRETEEVFGTEIDDLENEKVELKEEIDALVAEVAKRGSRIRELENERRTGNCT
jgi:uncharacterized protein YdcH (DUF465 family)